MSADLTAAQRIALEWIVREALELSLARDLHPHDQMVEAGDVYLLAKLSGDAALIADAATYWGATTDDNTPLAAKCLATKIGLEP